MTVRVDIKNKPGMMGKLTSAIGKKGGDIGAVDMVKVGRRTVTRDITFNARDETHGTQVIVKGKVPLKTRDDLSMTYTPGVARVCTATQKDPDKIYSLTLKQNCVAVITDGTAVLGLGDIGPKGDPMKGDSPEPAPA